MASGAEEESMLLADDECRPDASECLDYLFAKLPNSDCNSPVVACVP